jgi:hypothetical protein
MRWGGGEMVDAADLKSAGRKSVWVRIPPALFTLKWPIMGPFYFAAGIGHLSKGEAAKV